MSLLPFLSFPVHAQDPPAVDDPNIEEVESAEGLEESTETEGLPDLLPIMADLEKLRGLKFKHTVVAAEQSLEAFRDEMLAELDEMLPKDRRDDLVQGLLRFGMIDRAIDLESELANLMMTQVAGYYDAETDRFFYLPIGLEDIEAVAAHELVHALQDQHFDLAALTDKQIEMTLAPVRNDDRSLAYGYVVEGEASFVEERYMALYYEPLFEGGPTAEKLYYKSNAEIEDSAAVILSHLNLDNLGEMAGGDEYLQAMEDASKLPTYFIRPMMSQYTYGAYFIACVFHHGGWPAIDALYENLPRSTEQVLHPEKYLDESDEPTMISLHDSESLTKAGWKRVDAAAHGEFYMRLLLEQQGVTRFTAIVAAEGWDGDLYQAYRNPTGQTLITFVSTWDTESDAAEFYHAYLSSFAKKYPGVTSLATNTPTAVEFDSGKKELGWVRLTLRGREVIAVEGGSRELMNAVHNELIEQKIQHTP